MNFLPIKLQCQTATCPNYRWVWEIKREDLPQTKPGLYALPTHLCVWCDIEPVILNATESNRIERQEITP